MFRLIAIFLLTTSLAANAEWLKIEDRPGYRQYVETNSVRETKTGSIAEFLTEIEAPEGIFSSKELQEYNCTTYASRLLAYIHTHRQMGKGKFGEGEVDELSNTIVDWSEGGTDLSSVDAKMRFACSKAKKYAKNSAPHKQLYYTLDTEPYDPKKWLKFGSGEHFSAYVDISRMKPTSTGVELRILNDFKGAVDPDTEYPPDWHGPPFNSSITMTEFNCATNQYREVKHIYFSGKLGTGVVSHVHGNLIGWSNIVGSSQVVLSQHLIACTVLRDVATGSLKSIPPDFNFDDTPYQPKKKIPSSQQISM